MELNANIDESILIDFLLKYLEYKKLKIEFVGLQQYEKAKNARDSEKNYLGLLVELISDQPNMNTIYFDNEKLINDHIYEKYDIELSYGSINIIKTAIREMKINKLLK